MVLLLLQMFTICYNINVQYQGDDNLNAYSDAKKMSHQELEIASKKILAKHSLSDVTRKTFLSYQTVWRLRKSSADREKASLVTLVSIVSAFPDDIK